MPLVYGGKEIGVSIKSNDFGEFLMFSEIIPFKGEDREGCLWAELPYFDFTEESKKAFCYKWAEHYEPEYNDTESKWEVVCDTPIDDESYKVLKSLFPPDCSLMTVDSYVHTMEYLEEQKQESIENGIWEEFLPE